MLQQHMMPRQQSYPNHILSEPPPPLVSCKNLHSPIIEQRIYKIFILISKQGLKSPKHFNQEESRIWLLLLTYASLFIVFSFAVRNLDRHLNCWEQNCDASRDRSRTVLMEGKTPCNVHSCLVKSWCIDIYVRDSFLCVHHSGFAWTLYTEVDQPPESLHMQ